MGTDSDGEDGDSIPELEDTAGGEASTVDAVAAAAGLGEDGVSKNKQSRGEKKANPRTSCLSSRSLMCTRIQLQIPTLSLERPRLRTCHNRLRWRQLRSSRMLKFLKQPKLQLLAQLPSSRRMKMTKMLMLREWRRRMSSWSCLRPMSPGARLPKLSKTMPTILSMLSWS